MSLSSKRYVPIAESALSNARYPQSRWSPCRPACTPRRTKRSLWSSPRTVQDITRSIVSGEADAKVCRFEDRRGGRFLLEHSEEEVSDHYFVLAVVEAEGYNWVLSLTRELERLLGEGKKAVERAYRNRGGSRAFAVDNW